MLLLLHP